MRVSYKTKYREPRLFTRVSLEGVVGRNTFSKTSTEL